MEMQEVISRAERNIRQALSDYEAHTRQTDVLDDVTDTFVRILARDSSHAKQGLRELFSKSPVWNEELDALVINGTRTHDPDYDRVYKLAFQILEKPLKSSEYDWNTLVEAINFFSNPDARENDRQRYIEAIQKLAPKAYSPTKKLSRVFKALCVALGVADESAGSEFQRLYAQFADELSARQIGFKLFVSINPAHFITMSNPKCDRRGSTLTSCHSFNSTEYDYNGGCSGYARDEVSFIVFTVDDPTNPELLNNRKTTRQVFAYRPGSGLLLQSRMYNTSGGVYGAAADSKLYRDLVQREISALEDVPNLWKTCRTSGRPTRPPAIWRTSLFAAVVSVGIRIGSMKTSTATSASVRTATWKPLSRWRSEPMACASAAAMKFRTGCTAMTASTAVAAVTSAATATTRMTCTRYVIRAETGFRSARTAGMNTTPAASTAVSIGPTTARPVWVTNIIATVAATSFASSARTVASGISAMICTVCTMMAAGSGFVGIASTITAIVTSAMICTTAMICRRFTKPMGPSITSAMTARRSS